MKKCIIYVFSGTGNTRLIADLYKKYLSDYETVIYDVRCKDGQFLLYPNPNEFDLVGIGYPVHGFNSPKIMWDFCKQLPDAEKTGFIFTSSGEGLGVNDFSYQKILVKMEKKGYRFLTARRYVMPYNMIFRHTPEMVKSEYWYADAVVKLNCSEISESKSEKLHHCSPLSFFVPIVRILWPYARIQSKLCMKVDMNKCIKCQKCVKACPYGNITYDSEKQKFTFGTDCVLCVACSFGCPKKAIGIGLLNGWRVNGSYKIEQTAADKAIKFPAFGENLKGLKRWLYYGYYRKLDKMLEKAGVTLKPDNL